MNDPDHPIWILLSGAFILAVSVLMLYGNYQQWETEKDLVTASSITTAYFVAAVSRRIWKWRKEK